MSGAAISRVAVAFGLMARADAIERMRDPRRVQPHSRLFPSETELAEAKFAAQQLRVAAGEIMAGLEPEAGEDPRDG